MYYKVKYWNFIRNVIPPVLAWNTADTAVERQPINTKNAINSACCAYRFSRKFGRNGTGSGSYVGSVPRPPGPRGRRQWVLQCALKTRVCQPWFWRETKTRTRQITWHKTETWNYVISMETMTRRSVKLLIVKGAGMNCCDDGEMCEEIHVP